MAEDDKKTIKFQMMMSPAEAEALDDWGFKRRIKSRAESIRRLCQFALMENENLATQIKNVLEISSLIKDEVPPIREIITRNEINEEDRLRVLSFLSRLQDADAELLFDTVSTFVQALPLVSGSGGADDNIAAFRALKEFIGTLDRDLTGGRKLATLARELVSSAQPSDDAPKPE